ncbi:DedA family protein [Agromyces aureus]|uniref:Alanine dehydrogenase n=1 Tax=Agromyces aureus TaxID=453304 RepID=A0A191WJ61_9MICO|nr:DedA family protein [Agromyces aureus]ANJ28214.1 alanine dehydrogenase [Agromyces aureus]
MTPLHTVPLTGATLETADHGFTGLTGFAADVLNAMGDAGVGVLVFLEVLIPPIPSEVILPFAGYLSQSGDLNLGWLIAWSTLASVLGALLLYALGSVIGLRRAIDWVAWTKLVSRTDLESGAGWFHRYGRWSVLFGRMIPGVRSLISLPAGADRMPLATFVVFTALGSAAWNTLLIGVGAALGTQHQAIDHWLQYLDYLVYGAIAIALAVLVVRRIREQRGVQRSAGDGSEPAES